MSGDLSDLEDRLATAALVLAGDMRSDLGAAHRTVRYLSKPELEQLCCVLAAMVDPDQPFNRMAWWRLKLVREAS